MSLAGDAALVLALGLVLDAIVGDPPALYSRLPHPVALLGRAIVALERILLARSDRPRRQKLRGGVLVVLMVGGTLLAGAMVERLLLSLPLGPFLLAVAVSLLLAQRSLVEHVRAVASGLAHGLQEGRAAVSRIVGRDPDQLDQAAVGRAAIESLAENLSDGVVAPAFWFLIAGLPGLLAYKAVNTLDSMVGHRNERYRHFGWASARLDDLLNLVPARLTALLILAPRHRLNLTALQEGWRRTAANAPHHRSPNAGWPEAAMAHALGLRLAGPRVYGGRQVEDAWMGDGRAAVSPDDIESAIGLAWQAWLALLLLVVLLAIAS